VSFKYETIKDSVSRFIINREASEEPFNRLALDIFAYQYENNEAFRKYCRKRRVSPVNVKHFTDIPAVPIAAFKEAQLSCCPPDDAQAVFMTSGTTNPEKKGKNYHRDLEVYDLSMKRHFKDYILPDMERIKMYILFPTEEQLPHSSLAHYLQLAITAYGTRESEYVVNDQGFDMELLTRKLQEDERRGEPAAILGATFSFIHYLDYCAEQGIKFRLPHGSRVMDTGGAKGRSKEMDPIELQHRLADLFSLPDSSCVNMYGMSELSSQFYDGNLRCAWLNEDIRALKTAPHWVRTTVVDPETMEPKRQSESGILVHYDLANINSVCAVLTEDLGMAHEQGFQLLGRAQGVEAKGCSLAMEQFVAVTEREKGS
jgi:hypothetical protein